MAAERAAELTEAYRILSDDGRRAEYDRARGRVRTRRAAATPAAPPATRPSPAAGQRRSAAGRARAAAADGIAVPAGTREPRRVRPQGDDQPAAQALEAVGGGYDEAQVARVRHRVGAEEQAVRARQRTAPARSLRGRRRSRRGRRRVDAGGEDGATPDRRGVRAADGHGAGAGRRAGAARSPSSGGKSRGARLTLIPVDARNWDAHMPLDAPAVAKTLLARLRTGA